MTEIETVQIGRVDRVIQPVGIRPYGFILDSAGKRFFFRKTDCRGEVMVAYRIGRGARALR